MAKARQDSTEWTRKKFVSELYRPGSWFQTPAGFFSILKPDAAVFLAVLLSQSEFVGARERTRDWEGWFYMRIDFVERTLKMNRNRQARILRTLIRKKFVQRQSRGVPAKRYFRVNVERIHEAIEKAEKRSSDVAES